MMWKRGKNMSKVEKSFEEALDELEKIVSKLERGELSLDESIDFFQKGIELSKFCNKCLNEVEKRITMLIEDEKGALKEENFENDGLPEV